MEFQGRIYKILPEQTGTGKNGTWRKVEFIFEYFENKTDRWSDKVLLSAMNDNIDKYDLHEGDEVVIGFGHNINEWNGKYYNELRMYKCEKIQKIEDVEKPKIFNHEPELAPESKPGQEEKQDDLPF